MIIIVFLIKFKKIIALSSVIMIFWETLRRIFCSAIKQNLYTQQSN
ncbi:hypothetical protein J2W55_000651 [Mucilaginibacter pocheonensis]|uniref:Uncharacterized protein n=1 Tax=Mucilaginibacter pocheonensis TaxID=398050 RepID=A0ABU1T651_9SPHI|nr:hypothetical protein [Mucilaginibacter pocheonensis]